MNDIDKEKILSSFAKISKQWGLGEPVGKVWGFLLFKPTPVTQKEIEEGTNYSRGLISRSLEKLKALDMVSVTKKGREFYYSSSVSLIKGFNKVVKNFLETEIKPIIEYLSKNLDEVENPTISKNIHKMMNEYKKLNLGILLFSKNIDNITSLNIEDLRDIDNITSLNIEDLREVAQKYSIEL